MMPVFNFRWEPTAGSLLERDRRQAAAAPPAPAEGSPVAKVSRSNPFESYFGFLRQGLVSGVKLRDDWGSNPPRGCGASGAAAAIPVSWWPTAGR